MSAISLFLTSSSQVHGVIISLLSLLSDVLILPMENPPARVNKKQHYLEESHQIVYVISIYVQIFHVGVSEGVCVW